MEDEDYVTHKPHIWGNEEEEWVEDLEVKIVLTSQFQMMTQSFNNKCRRKEYGIQKFKISVSRASTKLTYVFM